jgi:hypothetical protein
VTGNGTFGASGSDYGMSALKFSPTLTLLSSFTPYNYATLNSNDDDLCSSLMLIPGSTSCTMQGKTGSVYVMNRNSLGGFNASGDKIVQRLDNAFATDGGSGDPVSVFWNNLFYLWAGDDYLKAFKFSGTTLTATLQSSNEIYQSGASGAISLSASNDSNGIVWGTNVSTGHVYAFNASKVATMLWNDGQASGSRDALGSPVQKFARITVVNGKVYVPTSNSLVVYGLLAGGLSKPTGVLDNEAGTAVADNFRMTRHYFALSFRHAGTYEISVSDMRGCIVARARGVTTGGAIQIALRGNGLQPGAYIAFVTMGQRRMTGQAVIGQ